jgi:hypothetical protein
LGYSEWSVSCAMAPSATYSIAASKMILFMMTPFLFLFDVPFLGLFGAGNGQNLIFFLAACGGQGEHCEESCGFELFFHLWDWDVCLFFFV